MTDLGSLSSSPSEGQHKKIASELLILLCAMETLTVL